MKKIILLAFLTISFNLLHSASLRVQDPQTWQSYNGKITEFTVDVTPVGIYFQYEIYITFAAQDNVYSQTDSVEIIYNFSLPSEALITDSWLWIYDKPEKAYLLDVWTATSIYEGIVNRRKDPSLFRKTSPTDYSLNIYPMGGKSSRKVKITMMLPAEWQNDKIQSIFPNSMVNSLGLIPEKIKINLKKSENWQSPTLEPYSTKSNDEYLVAKDDYANYPITISYANPSTDNTFFTVYQDGSEKYYQFLISPFSTEITNTPKKLLFVFDKYSYSDTYGSLVDGLYSYSFSEIKKGSKINVFYDNAGVASRLATNWLNSDDPILLNNLFTALKTGNYSQGNTLNLLKKAIEYNNANGGDAQIILISNTPSYYQKSNLASLVNTLYKEYENVPAIDVIYYKPYSYNYYYYDYYYYNNYENDTYLSEIARRTKGNYKSLEYNSDLSKYINLMYFNQQSISNEYSLLTSTENGFCYDQINLFNDDFGINSIEPIVQVGKFVGDLPITVELKYIENDVVYNKSYTFDESNIITSDSLLKQIWAGQTILENEWSSNQDNNDISDIIITSTSNRVLSRYTAFLALEPDMIELIEEISQEDKNEDGIPDGPVFTTSTNSLTKENSSINITENTNESIVVMVTIGDEELVSSFELVDILGKSVYQQSTNNETFTIDKTNLTSGVYVVKVTTNKNIYSLKIVIQ